MNYPKDFDRHLIKRIEVEQKFADYIYKEFKSKRYGLASCSLGQMDKYKIKKELCDWNDLKLKTYSSTTYEEINFYPIPENNPNLFDSETITTETTTPITTYTTTETVLGDPIWVVDDCMNSCVYPGIYKPTFTQLNNDSIGIDGSSVAVGGNAILGMNTGRNAMFKFNQLDLENIPNNSGNAQVTFYSKIDFLAYMQEAAQNSVLQTIVGDYGPLGAGAAASVSLAIYDWYTSDFTTNGFLNNFLLPPKSAFDEYESTGSSFYYIPMAQFTLTSATNMNGDPSVKPAFRYIDPILEADELGNNAYSEIDIDGVTHYTGDLDDLVAITLFGAEKGFSVASQNQNNWYALNGGFVYRFTQAQGNQSYMRAVVKDGFDVYQTDFTLPDGTILESGMPDTAVYYTLSSEFGGSFLNSEYALSNPDEILSYGNEYLWEPLSTTDLLKPSCSFQWGIGTVTTGENISQSGDIIEQGVLDVACTFIGMETWVEEETIITEGGETITQTVTNFECKTDNEYIIFKVYNQLGDPVEGYDIIINGGNTGKTNKSGIFKTIIENASTKTKHTLNICHCFTTTGACTQKEIKIIVNDDDVTNITINKIDCTPISTSE